MCRIAWIRHGAELGATFRAGCEAMYPWRAGWRLCAAHAVAHGGDGHLRGAHSASREAPYRSRRHVDYVSRATVAVMSSAALSCRRSRPRSPRPSSRRYSSFRTVPPPAYRARRSAAASTGQQKGAPHSIIRRRKHCASSARSRTRKALLSTSSCERPRPSSYALRWAFHNAPSCGLPE